jgi:hypothetical protein
MLIRSLCLLPQKRNIRSMDHLLYTVQPIAIQTGANNLIAQSHGSSLVLDLSDHPLERTVEEHHFYFLICISYNIAAHRGAIGSLCFF